MARKKAAKDESREELRARLADMQLAAHGMAGSLHPEVGEEERAKLKRTAGMLRRLIAAASKDQLAEAFCGTE